MSCLAVICVTAGCGRKGDPIPRPRAEPGPCQAAWTGLRQLQVTLPERDARGERLVGIQRIRVLHAPLGASRPTARDLLLRGDVVLERSEPDLPGPGHTLTLDLGRTDRGPGWLLVVAVRVGNVSGQSGEILPWLHPTIR